MRLIPGQSLQALPGAHLVDVQRVGSIIVGLCEVIIIIYTQKITHSECDYMHAYLSGCFVSCFIADWVGHSPAKSPATVRENYMVSV